MFCRDIEIELDQREKDKNPIRVGIAGAGFLGRGLLNQLALMKGVTTIAVSSRNPQKAMKRIKESNPSREISLCENRAQIEHALAKGSLVLLRNPTMLPHAKPDIIADCIGDPEVGAHLCQEAIDSEIHFIASPEMDATVGPALNNLAQKKGLIYSGADGDEPGTTMGLYRYVSLIGFEIIAAGKFKDYYNPESTPTSVKPWAEKYDHNPYMIASFADGTKMNLEMAVLANATGLIPGVRGMHCPTGTLDTIPQLLELKKNGGILARKGVVEVILNAKPSAGVFVVATTGHQQIRKDLEYLKMGEGPNYLFYYPYHLCGVEMGLSLAQIVIHGLPTIAPQKTAVAEVIAVAKKRLKPGDVLDKIGGFSFYGLIDRSETVKKQKLLPVGLAQGVRVIRPVEKGDPIPLESLYLDRSTVLWDLYNDNGPYGPG